MEDEADGYKETRLNFELHKHLYPEDLRDSIREFLELSDYWYNQYIPWIEALRAPLQELMLAQYPLFRTLTDPIQLKHMADTIEHGVGPLLPSMRQLVQEYRSGAATATLYPELEEWRSFYCRPEQPHLITPDDRKYHPRLTDAEWAELVERENRIATEYQAGLNRRREDWNAIVQPLLHRYLPEVLELEGDYWVLYAVQLRDHYDTWQTWCEYLETAVAYGLPPGSVDWEEEAYSKAIRESPLFPNGAYDEARVQRIIADGKRA